MSKLKDATAAAAATTQGTEQGAPPTEYTAVGTIFTDWFNDKLRQIVNPTIQLGTKQASAVRLHPNGRLECTLHAEAGDSQTFVAFEAQYLDQLAARIAALGL